jgi:hypothetical protein
MSSVDQRPKSISSTYWLGLLRAYDRCHALAEFLSCPNDGSSVLSISRKLQSSFVDFNSAPMEV